MPYRRNQRVRLNQRMNEFALIDTSVNTRQQKVPVHIIILHTEQHFMISTSFARSIRKEIKCVISSKLSLR